MATKSNGVFETTKVDNDSNEKRRILFVGGLPSSVDEEILRDYFSKIATVTNIKIARDKKSKGSKGYAYVTLSESSVIPNVIGTHHLLHNRKLDVQVASRKGERHIWKNEQRKRRLFLINLPTEVTPQEFEQAFSKFGAVHNAYTVVEPGDDQEKPYGYVEFEDPDSAEKALSAKVYIRGNLVTVSKFRNKDQNQSSVSSSKNIISADKVAVPQANQLALPESQSDSRNLLKNSGSRTSICTKSEQKLSGAGSPRELDKLDPQISNAQTDVRSDEDKSAECLPHPLVLGEKCTKALKSERSYRMSFILAHKLNNSIRNVRLNVEQVHPDCQVTNIKYVKTERECLLWQPRQLPYQKPATFKLFPVRNKLGSSTIQLRCSSAIGRHPGATSA